MAKMRESLCGTVLFVVGLIFAFLFLNVVTAMDNPRTDGRIDVPFGDFSSIVDQFEQKTFGNNYPVVTVEILPRNQLRATQKRFQSDQLGINVTEYTWNISLSYQTKEGNNGRMWLNKTEDVFDIPLNSSDGWILFNADESRKCRVKYDDALWNRITKQLKENHTEFSENNRSRLFTDARNLAKAGLLGYDKVLDLISHASNDRDMPLWYHIYDFVNFFGRMIYDTTSFFHFQRFMLNVTSSLRDEMTFNTPRDAFEWVINPYIWSMSCSFGHRDCIENTTRIFRARIESTSPIHKYTVGYRDVSCTGLAYSLLESDWDTIFEKYMMLANDKTLEERRLGLLYALSCSRNFTLLERLLERTIENTKNSARDFHYFSDAMDYIDSHPLSNYTAWKWLRLNRDKVDERMKPRSSMWFLKGLAYNLKTREQRQEVLDFFDNYPNETSYKSGILDNIDRNIRWRDRNLPIIEQWFKQNAP